MTSILGFLGAWAIRTSLVILLAAIVRGFLRRHSADARHVLWRCALAGSLLTGLGMLILPAGGLSGQIQAPAIAATLAPRIPPAYTLESPVRVSTGDSYRTAGSHHVQEVSPDGLDIWMLVGLAYCLGVLVTLARWGASLARTLAICRAARPDEGFEDVLIAEWPVLTVPFTLGWRKPVIVLPADSVAWSDSRRDAVVLHERSHVKRKDWIWQTASILTAAFQWFNPAVWLLADRLRATAEEAADNDVLAAGVAPSVYARELMVLATARRGAELAATRMAGRRNMAFRLRFILATNRVRTPAKRGFVLAAARSFGFVGFTLAACVAAPIDVSAVVVAMFQAHGEAKFSDGVRVSVVYVGPTASSTLPAWRFDGTLAGTGESLSGGAKYSGGSVPGKRGVVVAFDLIGMPPRDPDADPFRIISVRLGGELDNGGGLGGPGPGIRAENRFSIPESWTLADLQVGRGFGPYRAVADDLKGKGTLAIHVTSHETRESRTQGTTTTEYPVTVSDIQFTLPSAVKAKDWRLRGFDAAGKSLKIFVNMFSVRNSPDHRTFQAYCYVAPETISRFVLEARDYEWVTIKNVHLLPNAPAVHK